MATEIIEQLVVSVDLEANQGCFIHRGRLLPAENSVATYAARRKLTAGEIIHVTQNGSADVYPIIRTYKHSIGVDGVLRSQELIPFRGYRSVVFVDGKEIGRAQEWKYEIVLNEPGEA